ncbi:MAG TPA: sulfatase-like hydrolase/transferase [Planctomycetota bacterium]
MFFGTFSLLVLSLPLEPVRNAPVQSPAPDVLMIVLDDVGMDLIGGLYQEVPDAPFTPNIDRLAREGVFFRNAWANPYCSPTRATLLTGRYGFRTGVGTYINGITDTYGLRTRELMLGEMLHYAGYYNAAFGKWHLSVKSNFGPGQGFLHPFHSGFDWYEGAMYNPASPAVEYLPASCSGPLDYYNWVKNTNGVQDCTRVYMTTDTVDDAVAFLRNPPEPLFLYVAFNAAHAPMHDPTGRLPANAPARSKCKAMVEVMDAEIGRLLSSARYPRSDLYVILVGDNGTEFWVGYGAPNATGCFGTAHSKGSLYEGGINVPLIIAGPGVVARETPVIVNTTDVFATVCNLTGLPSLARDSRSLTGVMFGSDLPVRDYVYAEQFSPNGRPFRPTTHERTVSDGRYKLIRRTSSGTTADELFDLLQDPCEDVDLLPTPPGSPAEQARVRLVGYLTALGVD